MNTYRTNHGNLATRVGAVLFAGALAGAIYALSSAPSAPQYGDVFRVRGTVVERVEESQGVYPNGSERTKRDFLIRPIPGEYEFQGRIYTISSPSTPSGNYFHVGTKGVNADGTPKWGDITVGDTVEISGKNGGSCYESDIFQRFSDHDTGGIVAYIIDEVVPETSLPYASPCIVDVKWARMHNDGFLFADHYAKKPTK